MSPAAKEVAARMMGGEMMIMSARDSTLFNLNETASAIWQRRRRRHSARRDRGARLCTNSK